MYQRRVTLESGKANVAGMKLGFFEVREAGPKVILDLVNRSNDLTPEQALDLASALVDAAREALSPATMADGHNDAFVSQPEPEA